MSENKMQVLKSGWLKSLKGLGFTVIVTTGLYFVLLGVEKLVKAFNITPGVTAVMMLIVLGLGVVWMTTHLLIFAKAFIYLGGSQKRATPSVSEIRKDLSFGWVGLCSAGAWLFLFALTDVSLLSSMPAEELSLQSGWLCTVFVSSFLVFSVYSCLHEWTIKNHRKRKEQISEAV